MKMLAQIQRKKDDLGTFIGDNLTAMLIFNRDQMQNFFFIYQVWILTCSKKTLLLCLPTNTVHGELP